jgi:hypothetical protein
MPDNPTTYTVELGGQVFTEAQWEAVQAYVAGTSPVSTEDALLASWARKVLATSDGFTVTWFTANGPVQFNIDARGVIVSTEEIRAAREVLRNLKRKTATTPDGRTDTIASGRIL